VLLFDDRDTVNACGNFIQLSGHSGSRGLGQPSTAYTEPEEVACPCGASFLMERAEWLALGGFDTKLMTFTKTTGSTSLNYYQEATLAWRLLGRGYCVKCVPSSVVYHKYRVKPITPSRYFDLEVTHLAFVMRFFGPRTLLAVLPALLVSEVVSWCYALSRGPRFIAAKFRACAWLCRALPPIRQDRRRIAQDRTVPERAMFARLTPSTQFAHQYRGRSFARVLQAGLNAVYRLTHVLATWLLAGLEAVWPERSPMGSERGDAT
jgi:GT2 family glycosyltransferase